MDKCVSNFNSIRVELQFKLINSERIELYVLYLYWVRIS